MIGTLVAGGVSGSLLNPLVTVGLTAVGRLASIWAPSVPRSFSEPTGVNSNITAVSPHEEARMFIP